MPTKDTQRSFRLSTDLDARLVAKAKKLDRSTSWVINRALEVALLGEDRAMQAALKRGMTTKRG